MSSKRILVTGVAGFIASHVAERLLERGDVVIGFDEVNNYYSLDNKKANLQEVMRTAERCKQSFDGENFVFIKGELGDKELLVSILRDHKITHVAHLAARAGVRPSIESPILYQEANAVGTATLLEAMKIVGVKNGVITSSSSVYGSSTKVPFSEDDGATDRPISPYAATKKATEVLAYTYHSLYGMQLNVVRPFTVYGPRGRPDMAPWIFLESAINGKAIKRFGDGTTRRDYTYISDLVSGFVAAIDHQFGYEIFNLGNSDTVSLNDAIAIIERVTGKTLKLEEHPLQPGDVPITYADVSKARSMLGYNPATSFEVGMTKFFEWYTRNLSSV